jgi:hypothetical protein
MTYDDTPTGQRMAALERQIEALTSRLDAQSTIDIQLVAHGPLDGRHIIVIPDAEDEDPEMLESIVQSVIDHFSRAWQALNPGEEIDAAAVVPLILFGEGRVEPVPPCEGCGEVVGHLAGCRFGPDGVGHDPDSWLA